MKVKKKGRFQHVLSSGGAPGADTLFATECLERTSHVVCMATFKNHNLSFVPCHKERIKEGRLSVNVCDKGKLEESNPHMKTAAVCLGRDIPRSVGYIQRDYHEIVDADRVYAVGYREDAPRNGKTPSLHYVGIVGGTGWTSQMFVNLIIGRTRALFTEFAKKAKEERLSGITVSDIGDEIQEAVDPHREVLVSDDNTSFSIPLFFYDQTSRTWSQPSALFTPARGRGLEWTTLDRPRRLPSKDHDRPITYAGIGSRDLQLGNGDKAIVSLFDDLCVVKRASLLEKESE